MKPLPPPYDEYYRLMSAYFERVLSSRSLYKECGIKDVAPAPRRGSSSWYVELQGVEGIYELVLGSYGITKIKSNNQSDKWSPLESYWSYFVIKYYPGLEEGAFDEFSFYEKLLRVSYFFNEGESRVPLAQYKSEIHDSFFSVGSLHLFLEKRARLIRLLLCTQDLWMNYNHDGIKAGSGEWAVEPGQVDRRVRGWDVCWPLFSRLVKMYRLSLSVDPYMVYLVSKPGKIWHVREGRIYEVSASSCPERRLEVAFVIEGEFDKLFDYLLGEIRKSIGETADPRGRGVSSLVVLYREGRISIPRGYEKFFDPSWLKPGR